MKSRTSGTNLWFRRRQWSSKNDFLNRGREKKISGNGFVQRWKGQLKFTR